MSSAKLLIPAALLTAVALIGPSALAVGLGSVNVESRLNQPLRAEIPLLSVSQGEADKIQAQLASPEDFERIGLDRPAVLTQLDFSVDKSGTRPVIRVSSERPVRDPFLTFLVRLEWPQGQLLREYTVLLDPPALAPAAAPAPAREPSRAVERESGAAQAEKQATREASSPSATTAAETPQPARQPTPRGEAVPGGAGRYGPVNAGETLWSIANRTRPDQSISVNQMMLALLRTNPDAFYRDNINALKRGAVLRIPDIGELRRLGTAEALQAVRRQNDLWQQYRRDLAKSAPTVVAGGEQPREQEPPDSESREGSHLELVPPRQQGESAGAESAVAGPSESGETQSGQNLKQELARTREALLAQKQQNQQNSDRVNELEEQVQRLQRLVELKNSELATLQQQSTGGETQQAGAESESQQPPAAEEQTAQAQGGQAAAGEENPFDSTGQPEQEETTAAAGSEQAPAGAQQTQTEQAKPQTQPKPPPPPPSRGWMDTLLSPMVLGLLGILLVGIGIALFLHRRRAGGDEYAETTLQRETVASRGRGEVAVDESEQAVQEAPDEEWGPQEAGPADYDEAALRAALDEDPADTETRLKLMRHYAATEQRDAFIAQAETLYAQLADPGADAWLEARRMGEDLVPDHPLFGGEQDIRSSAEALEASPEEPAEESWEHGADTTEPFGTAPEESGDDTEAPPADELPDLEFERPEVPGSEEAGSPAAELGETASAEEGGDDSDFQFDFTETREESASEAGEPEAPETGATQSGEPTEQSFDLGDMAKPREPGEPTLGENEFELGDLETGSDESTEDWMQTDEPEEPRESGEDTVVDTGAPAPPAEDADAVTTKIELAEAYAEMGDSEGARELLQEVLGEGNEEQQNQARELLERLG